MRIMKSISKWTGGRTGGRRNITGDVILTGRSIRIMIEWSCQHSRLAGPERLGHHGLLSFGYVDYLDGREGKPDLV